MPALNHQTAVVRGASRGIGAAIALALAEEGAQLHLVGRNSDALEAVAQRARTNSSRVLTYRVDLGIDADLEKLKTDLKLDCDGMDILVHSAGVIAIGPLETASLADFDRQYRTNVRAPYALTQALLPMLRARHGGLLGRSHTIEQSIRPRLHGGPRKGSLPEVFEDGRWTTLHFLYAVPPAATGNSFDCRARRSVQRCNGCATRLSLIHI